MRWFVNVLEVTWTISHWLSRKKHASLGMRILVLFVRSTFPLVRMLCTRPRKHRQRISQCLRIELTRESGAKLCMPT